MPMSNIQVDSGAQAFSDGQLFSVEVWLDNHTNQKTKVAQGNIFELVIEEDVFKWPYRGYIVYSNPFEWLERDGEKDAWFYRMDCRDEITIKIKMIPEYADSANQFEPEVWEMHLDCVVYNTEDMPADQMVQKHKKLYFWDKKYQIMREKKAQWSTATAQNIEFPSHSTDLERSMLTGDAIKYLLEDVAGYEGITHATDWDTGSSKCLYTSPTCRSINDDLDYLLSEHVSQENEDFCLFGYTDRSENKKLNLVAMNKIFSRAGKDVNNPGDLSLEHFFFEPLEDKGEGMTTPFRAPYKDDISFKIDIKIAEWNKISMYDFVDMSGIDNSVALVSRPVYSYNLKNKGFSVDAETNEISNIKDDFRELYIKHLLPEGSSEPIFTLNKTKTEQIAIDPQFVYSYSDDFNNNRVGRLVYGKLKTLMNAVFINEFIEFTVNGSPHRTVGRFIGIDRHSSIAGNRFDDKICGQWFVTNVKHIWSFNRYINKISAVKINTFNKHEMNEDVE